ncbi:MAG TPA: hypothetical protein VE646_08460 [Actinomycetota bacterium]|nr:hypothetical protein [Actinomycetota bacterium]
MPGTPKDTTTERSSRTDAVLVAALTAVLLAWFAGPFVIRGIGFPLGPDAPVYLWWTRLAGAEGLSAPERAGVPALALVLGGTLHLPLVAITAALEIVFGVGVGLASAALLRAGRRDRVAWMLAGLLAGAFAVHLAAGYLANLVFAALFLASAATLAEGAHRGPAAAAGLLAAAGFAHPLFFLLGILILLAAALLAWQADRAEARRVGAAVSGAGAVLGIGLLALLAGPGPPAVDTSKDAFLRRAGLGADLRGAYLGRFLQHWPRYVQWASLPLAVMGLLGTVGYVGRFLLAWGVALVVGVLAGLATGAFPADRFLTFGYVVPILAAIGVIRLWWGLRRRPVLAWLAAVGLVAAMLGGALLAWSRQPPFIDRQQIAEVTVAGRYAAATPTGTPLLFRVDSGDAATTFLATQAANLIRAALPPDRIRDVYVVVPPLTGSTALSPRNARERRALVFFYDRDAARAIRAAAQPPLLFDLLAFDAPGYGSELSCPELSCQGDRGPMQEVAPGVRVDASHPAPVLAPVDPLGASSPADAVVAALAALALIGAVGYGWARTLTPDRPLALLLCPLLGAAALMLSGIILERLGLPLTGWVGPTAVSALAGLSGYAGLIVLQRPALA